MGNQPSCQEVVKGDEASGWLFNLLDFCDETTRANCLFLSQRHYKILSSDASFKWRLERLHIEKGVYSPTELQSDHTWRSLFLELHKKRCIWDADDCDGGNSAAKDDAEQFNISVYARFKPLNAGQNSVGRDITLPLHQRLALIRIDKCLDSNKDALKVLKDQGGWFKERWEEIEKVPGENVGIQCDTRLPKITSGVQKIDVKSARVVVVDPTKGLQEFQFDGVMNGNVHQKEVYDLSTRSLVCDLINGVSATCLVYGQTGSGKTFTMFGAPEMRGSSSNLNGIVPLACSDVMSAVRFRKESLNIDIECTISISFVEIFGNEVLDLIGRGRRCGASKVSAQRCVLDGNVEVTVESIQHVMQLLREGEAQRRRASTAMNSRSSRSHSIFIVSLKQKCINSGKSIHSKLFLADLGGCEQTKKSKLDAGQSQHVEELKRQSSTNELTTSDVADTKAGVGFVKSDRMREAVYINLGLMSLKSCVTALSRGRGSHVPYANNKLTMILSTGLGGNSKTSVIVCASQEEQHSSETINALKFGQSCRMVSNVVRTHADMLGDLMKDLDIDISACEERIRKNERWVVHEEKRTDTLAEEGTVEAMGLGGIEVKRTTVLVGAEDDRKLLHSLLLKKSQLSGSVRDESKSSISESNTKKYGGHVGFGSAHEYGLGSKFSLEDEKENYRFNESPQEESVPDTVRFCKEESKSKATAYMGISA